MKRFLLLMITVMVSLVSLAQQKDVTKFLGIPVDGAVSSMRQKLIAKGFKTVSLDKDFLEGRFNGSEVYITLAANKGKLWRIVVMDKNCSNETDIIIRFNNLYRQFLKNGKYVCPEGEDCFIPDNTDLRYEMTINHKRYEVGFYQATSEEINKDVERYLLSKFSKDELSSLTDKQRSELSAGIKDYDFRSSKKSVWFMINEMLGGYRICLFYDNKYNEADGEDL